MKKLKEPKNTVRIGLVGKYNKLPDAYKSINESFVHAGAANECKVEVEPIHAEALEVIDSVGEALAHLDGVLVAPGFGERGIEGKQQDAAGFLPDFAVREPYVGEQHRRFV